MDLIANAEFGGSARDVILAPGAAALFMADAEIKELLNTDYRGSEDVHINRSIIRTDPMNPFTYLGTLGSGIRVWRYVGSFMNNDGTTTNVMGNLRLRRGGSERGRRESVRRDPRRGRGHPGRRHLREDVGPGRPLGPVHHVAVARR